MKQHSQGILFHSYSKNITAIKKDLEDLQQAFISYSYGGWGVQDQGASRFVVW